MKTIYLINNKKKFQQRGPFYNKKFTKIYQSRYYKVYLEKKDNQEIFIIYNNKSKKYLEKIIQSILVDVLEEKNVMIIE